MTDVAKVLEDLKNQAVFVVGADQMNDLLGYIQELQADNRECNQKLEKICELMVNEVDRNLDLDIGYPMVGMIELANILGQTQFNEVYRESLEERRKMK